QQVQLVRDAALVDLPGGPRAMVRDPQRLPGAHAGQVLTAPGQLLEGRAVEDREHRADRVLRVGAVGPAPGGDLGPGLGQTATGSGSPSPGSTSPAGVRAPRTRRSSRSVSSTRAAKRIISRYWRRPARWPGSITSSSASSSTTTAEAMCS